MMIDDVSISKFLSFILRHNPDSIHLQLDKHGWASIDEFIENAKKYAHKDITYDMIEHIVNHNDKQRFALSADGEKIRANQGHSIHIDLGLTPIIPPDVLYHGTAIRFYEAIMAQGIKPMNRQYVHLSETEETAINVGSRHGKPIVLKILSSEMRQDGFIFYKSENGVWLTNRVPKNYIRPLA